VAVLFLHVGWAREYKDPENDPPVGKFGYIKAGNADGGEALNFRAYHGRYYGYAPQMTLNMGRLGGATGQETVEGRPVEYVDGVLVIWTAVDPAGGGSYVVGWYKNARVYAKILHKRPYTSRPEMVAVAKATNCHLVPVEERCLYIPRMKLGWPGHAAAFYASDNLTQEHLDQIIAYTNGEPVNPNIFYSLFNEEEDLNHKNGLYAGDPLLKAKVEEAAVSAVTSYYARLGWRVTSVEQDKIGWDLTLRKGAREIFVEVKGRYEDGPVELTPNEYDAMKSPQRRMSYRLAIVWHALSNQPLLTVFCFDPVTEAWVASCGSVLDLTPRTGARAMFEL
jgi:hypothetical protein